MRTLAWVLVAACQREVNVDEPTPDCPTAEAWADADGDGFGAGEVIEACEAQVEADGLVFNADDCDDADALIAPGVAELCDGVDQDCDEDIDEGMVRRTWFVDGDGDGWGAASVEACVQPGGSVDRGGDCDDAAGAVFPGADELCNTIDDDCDVDVDEDAIDAPTWYFDGDGDGWGVPSPSRAECVQPVGSSARSDDCDDADPTRFDVCVAPPPPPPPSGQAQCFGGTVYGFTAVTPSPELHYVSVYEPGATGVIDVFVERPVAMTLVLSSYEEVDWVLHVDPAVTLNGVLLNGFNAQNVTGVPGGVPTQTRTVAQTGTYFGYPCGYSWPYAGGGCDTNLLIAGVEAFTGQTSSGFIGCYTGEAFRVQ
jgi:hypothetical protein